MSEPIKCEFSLIRYVPDVVKGEFTNIGVVLREVSQQPLEKPSRNTVTQVRFTRDWHRVRCIDRDADIALLESLEDDIASHLISEAVTPTSSKPILELLEDISSNSIQITEPVFCEAENFALKMEELLRLYIEPIRVKVLRERTVRAIIHAAMRSEFERAGVWASMFKRRPVAEYTLKGDPLRLDCGYTPNGTIHVFHAVSLANDVDAAKGLAFTAPLLRDGLLRKHRAGLDLAAVVEPIRSVSPEEEGGEGFTDEAAELYGFGVATMESAGIRVLTTKDLARAAETARIELRL